MTTTTIEPTTIPQPTGLQKFWAKEDWWAVWLGLTTILLAYVF